MAMILTNQAVNLTIQIHLPIFVGILDLIDILLSDALVKVDEEIFDDIWHNEGLVLILLVEVLPGVD